MTSTWNRFPSRHSRVALATHGGGPLPTSKIFVWKAVWVPLLAASCMTTCPALLQAWVTDRPVAWLPSPKSQLKVKGKVAVAVNDTAWPTWAWHSSKPNMLTGGGCWPTGTDLKAREVQVPPGHDGSLPGAVTVSVTS